MDGPTEGATLALALAIAGLVLSVLAILWHVLDALVVDKARLRREIHSPIRLYDGTGQQRGPVSLTVNVTNVGKRRTRLTYLTLGLGKPPSVWQLARGKLRMKQEPVSWMNPDANPQNTRLPAVLDVGDGAILFYDLAAVEKHLDEIGAKHVYVRHNASTVWRRNGHKFPRRRFYKADKPPKERRK